MVFKEVTLSHRERERERDRRGTDGGCFLAPDGLFGFSPQDGRDVHQATHRPLAGEPRDLTHTTENGPKDSAKGTGSKHRRRFKSCPCCTGERENKGGRRIKAHRSIHFNIV